MELCEAARALNLSLIGIKTIGNRERTPEEKELIEALETAIRLIDDVDAHCYIDKGKVLSVMRSVFGNGVSVGDCGYKPERAYHELGELEPLGETKE